MKNATHRVFLLSGVIRCGECGRALIGQSAHGKHQVHRYYAHASNRKIGPVECSVRRYNANEMEKTHLGHLANDAKDAGYLDDLKTTIINNGESACSEVKKEIQRIEKAVKSVDGEIENVFRLQSENPLSASVREVITERLEKLSSSRKVHQDYLLELQHKQEDLLEGYYLTTSEDDRESQQHKKKKASGVNPGAFSSQLNHQPFSWWQPSIPTVAYGAEWWRRPSSSRGVTYAAVQLPYRLAYPFRTSRIMRWYFKPAVFA